VAPVVSDLTGKTIVVTGGARGIGAATVARLARGGATVVIVDILEDLGAETAREVTAAGGGQVSFRALDVTRGADVARVAGEVRSEHGRIDGLLNCAGIVESSPTFDLDDETWGKTIAVNLTGSFVCAREFGRHIADGGGGSVVNISSIAGLKAVHPELHVAYDASKAGVAQLTRSLAAEWAPLRVRVNAVAPGYTRTTILDAVGREDPQILEDWISQIPFGRLLEPPEIAEVVGFLLSDASSAVSGHVLVADAAYMIT
jgi:NAD(P)-dependent dehydrogenase (short-subunit alcohol dehydrogenase family)